MTLEQYGKYVRDSIMRASDIDDARIVIEDAKSALRDANLPSTDLRRFWINVYSDLNYSIKEVNHDASHAAVAQAKADIAEMLASGELK